MSSEGIQKAAENLLRTAKVISSVYAQLERNDPNMSTFLMNYAKTLRESIDQLTGSRAIDIPDKIEANAEQAINNPETMKLYNKCLVGGAPDSRSSGPKRSLEGSKKATPPSQTRSSLPSRSSSTGAHGHPS